MEAEGEMIGDADEQDMWTSSWADGVWRRKHFKARGLFFMPSDVAGSLSRLSLRSSRVMITEGNFNDDGESFIIVDGWTDRRVPHRDLGRRCTGTTSFDKSHRTRVGFTGFQISGTDEAAAPANNNDEDAEGSRAAPKPMHEG